MELGVWIIVVLAAAAVLGVLGWVIATWGDYRATRDFCGGRAQFHYREWLRDRRIDRRLGRRDGCEAASCNGREARHGWCFGGCGQLTCGRSTVVDPVSLRRRVPFICNGCRYGSIELADARQTAARTRTRNDWLRALPDQFPGRSRRLVRDFYRSSEEERILDGEPVAVAAAVNGTIDALGLAQDLYAEVRGAVPVLRRLSAGEALIHPGVRDAVDGSSARRDGRDG